MDFSTQVNALDKALLFADCTSALANITPENTIDPLLAAATGQPVQSASFVGTLACPRYYVGYSGGYIFVFINGTETLVQAAAYWTGLLGGGPLQSVSRPVNNYTLAAANLVLAQVRLRATGTPGRNVYFCGYSLGGAIANHASSLHAQADYRNRPFSWTIGCPRTLNARDAEFVSQWPSVRWMIDNDPVPLIPPSFAESPSTAILYGVRQQQRLNNFVHVGGGTQIGFTGTTSTQELPENAVWTTSGTLSNFLFSEDGAFGLEHSIAEYRRRFVLWRQTNPLPRARPSDPAPQEAPNPNQTREDNAQAAAVQRGLFRQGSLQNSIPVSVPVTALFSAQRSDGVWIVAFGDSFIAVGPTKHRARALARLGNEFLRRLLVQAVVSPVALEGQLSAFLTAAADPTSGIVPTLQVDFPS